MTDGKPRYGLALMAYAPAKVAGLMLGHTEPMEPIASFIGNLPINPRILLLLVNDMLYLEMTTR